MDNNAQRIIKLVTFQVSDYWFALPMKAILKIVNCPSSDKGGLVPLGMVQLGRYTIQLLDLHGTFCLDAHTTSSREIQFLLVLRGIQNTLWGITLESPPDLVELPISTFHDVSAAQRFVPNKQWISHIAILSEQEMSRTLLFLDLRAVFQLNKQQSRALIANSYT